MTRSTSNSGTSWQTFTESTSRTTLLLTSPSSSTTAFEAWIFARPVAAAMAGLLMTLADIDRHGRDLARYDVPTFQVESSQVPASLLDWAGGHGRDVLTRP